MNPKSLLAIDRLKREEILDLLHDSHCFSDSKKDWLVGKKSPVANLFFESSTRTHYSFALAELELGLPVEDWNSEHGSTAKGESLYDTCKTFESIGYSALVIRHPKDGYFDDLEGLDIPVVNAGDGCGNHPTQCLLDLYTILEEFHRLEGLKVAIVGDVLHSRVANSDYQALKSFGADVCFSGPEEFAREGFPFVSMDEALEGADVVMLLRIQFERLLSAMAISKEEYRRRYGLTKERYDCLKPAAIVLHPAPVNRGLEIDAPLVEAKKSRIFRQMRNGVYVRKAAIKRALGFPPFEERNPDWVI